MPEQTAAPQVEEAPSAPAATKPAEAAPEVAPPAAEDAPKGGDEVTKPTEDPAPVKAEEEADKTVTSESHAAEENDVVASNDKDVEMVADKPDPAIEKAADESVVVKMETSLSEEKPAEEKVADTPAESITQPPQQPAVVQPAVENNEPTAEVKTATNEQPQPPKQPQSTLPTRQYLDATVVPILHSALSQLAKVRPEDPIKFLGDYLINYKDNFASDRK